VLAMYVCNLIILIPQISTDLSIVKTTLTRLCATFKNVFYCPGNNELRLRQKEVEPYKHSIKKFEVVLEIANSVGAKTKPEKINDVWIGFPTLKKNF
jgi:UDP-2,3-diacylglucosamine pyrophosphatase LpxH